MRNEQSTSQHENLRPEEKKLLQPLFAELNESTLSNTNSFDILSSLMRIAEQILIFLNDNPKYRLAFFEGDKINYATAQLYCQNILKLLSFVAEYTCENESGMRVQQSL